MIPQRSNSHLQNVGESYFQHLCVAIRFGITMIWAGLACVIHAFLPSIFVTTGSQTIGKLAQEMQPRADKAQANQTETV